MRCWSIINITAFHPSPRLNISCFRFRRPAARNTVGVGSGLRMADAPGRCGRIKHSRSSKHITQTYRGCRVYSLAHAGVMQDRTCEYFTGKDGFGTEKKTPPRANKHAVHTQMYVRITSTSE